MNAIRTGIFANAAVLAIACPALSLYSQSSSNYHDSPYPDAQTGAAPGRYYAPPPNDKLYLRFDTGVALQQDIPISDSVGDSDKVTFDPGVRLDMMLGYEFTENWAAEFELGLIANQVKQSYVLGTDYMNVTYLQLPLLVDGIYTLPLNKSKSCSVYFGAGVGGVFSKYMDEYGDETQSDSAFACQGMAGFRWVILKQWEIGLAYKFLGTTEHDVGPGYASDGTPTEFKSDGTMTHSILLTLTCRF